MPDRNSKFCTFANLRLEMVGLDRLTLCRSLGVDTTSFLKEFWRVTCELLKFGSFVGCVCTNLCVRPKFCGDVTPSTLRVLQRRES